MMNLLFVAYTTSKLGEKGQVVVAGDLTEHVGDHANEGLGSPPVILSKETIGENPAHVLNRDVLNLKTGNTANI